jgi:cytochrome c oxidase subunit III
LSSSTTSVVAHHFDDAEQQWDAALLGMWMFLVTEIMFFGGVFLTYIVYRSVHAEAFALGSNHLDIVLGTLNTAVLITSSLTMALAVHSAQLGRQRRLLIFLILTMILGSMFLGVKGYEYAHKFHESLVPGPNFHWEGPDPLNVELFFSIYFASTGLHALHMIIGISILAVLTVQSWMGKYGSEYSTPIELTGLYWHFVDIVWIFLFPLLYLVARHH